MDDRVKSCCAGFYELPLIQSLLGDQWHPGGPTLTRRLASSVLIGRNTRVLDVASGTGESARVLAKHFGCHVTGVDFSGENCARASAMASESGLSEKTQFVEGDAEDLHFAADSFDVVICECSLCVFPSRSVALTEMRRVLRPGGRLGISDVIVNDPIPPSLQNLFGYVLCIGGALSISGYREAFAAAGFASIRSRDASYALDDMIVRVERRARAARELLNGESIELQPGWTVSRDEMIDARNFVTSGGVGYAMISGRKPSD